MYLGSWDVDALLTFPANTHRFDTGVATDADAVPTYRVYEDETATPILTGSMALLDGSNTAGFYSEQLTLSAANGFERGKSYTIYVTATVNSVVGTFSHTFQVDYSRSALKSLIDLLPEMTDFLTSGALADAVLDRNLAGGGSGNTRNVRNALRVLRNKVAIVAGTATVYAEDDTTSAWTAAITTAAGNPISVVDPA